MNIFYVDRSPYRAAECLVDKHVVKMILETAQILSTTHRLVLGKEHVTTNDKGRKVKRWIMDDVVLGENLYSATHVNHPSVKWARENSSHYFWLLEHFTGLLGEYEYRYGKQHACKKMYRYLNHNPLAGPYTLWNDPPLAMPDEYKISADHLECYRQYYRVGKKHLHQWTKRSPPDWI